MLNNNVSLKCHYSNNTYRDFDIQVSGLLTKKSFHQKKL